MLRIAFDIKQRPLIFFEVSFILPFQCLCLHNCARCIIYATAIDKISTLNSVRLPTHFRYDHVAHGWSKPGNQYPRL